MKVLDCSKVFRLSFQYGRTISRPASMPHNQLMERPTTEQLETMRDIDDLQSDIANLRRQLDFAQQQLRTMRIQTNRYEAILGMEESEAA